MAEPSTAKRLTVHARLGRVGLVTLPHRLLPTVCCVLLSHSEQPMVQPCENQKQLWPESHSLVPLAQRQLYGWIVPVIGCLRSSSKT